MISETTSVRVAPGQLSAPVGDEVVVLEIDAGVYYGMNEVAARVWKLVQEPRSVAQIRDVILDEFEVDRETATRDVIRLIEEMAARGLVELDPADR